MDCAEALELILDREALSDRELPPDGEAGSTLDERRIAPEWSIAPERRLALEAHLRTCADCSAQSKGLDTALAALRAGSAAGLSPAGETLDLWPGLRATLAAEGRFVAPNEARPLPTVAAAANLAPALQRARWRWSRVASLASAAAVLAIALPLLWNQDGGSGRETPAAFDPTTAVSTPAGANADRSVSGGSPLESAAASSSPGLAPQVAAEAPASADPSAGPTDVTGKGGLRHALGEKRQREFATRFDASGESGAWSLASDRELR